MRGQKSPNQGGQLAATDRSGWAFTRAAPVSRSLGRRAWCEIGRCQLGLLAYVALLTAPVALGAISTLPIWLFIGRWS